jgi:hypothetical protein
MLLKKLILPLALAIAVSCFPHRMSAQGKDVALETIGAITAIAVYNTYIAIGAVADGYADEGYKPDYVNTLMEEQVSAMEGLTTQLHDLQTSGFITDPEDDAYIEEFVTVVGYLREEAEGLKKIVEGGGNDLYEESREKAWAKISELLDLGDE